MYVGIVADILSLPVFLYCNTRPWFTHIKTSLFSYPSVFKDYIYYGLKIA